MFDTFGEDPPHNDKPPQKSSKLCPLFQVCHAVTVSIFTQVHLNLGCLNCKDWCRGVADKRADS